MSDIDISGIDKAALLAALYNRSKPLAHGFLASTPNDMTIEEARAHLAGGTWFAYLNGRPLRVELGGDTFNSFFYNRDTGEGAAQEVVEALRAGKSTPQNPSHLAGELERVITQSDGVSGIGADLIEELEKRRPLFRGRKISTTPES